MSRLDEADLSQKLSRKEQDKRLEAAQERLEALRLQLAGLIGDGRLGPPVLMLFEGWDASGKGGAIKRLVASLDHRHVRVAAFSAPTKDEKRHHFLWRFFPKLPGWGGVAVFDRSWYGRVLVDRGHVRAHRPRGRAVDDRAGRLEALRARVRGRARRGGDRAGDAPARDRA